LFIIAFLKTLQTNLDLIEIITDKKCDHMPSSQAARPKTSAGTESGERT
jgi:hypothetical protein